MERDFWETLKKLIRSNQFITLLNIHVIFIGHLPVQWNKAIEDKETQRYRLQDFCVKYSLNISFNQYNAFNLQTFV